MSESFSNETAAVDAAASFAAVAQTVATLVNPGGCAWHAEQTHDSLTPYLVEEAAELVDAIDRRLPATEMVSELADVLYQVVLHATIAERDGEGYGPADVAAHLQHKLVARHPHVFGDRGYMSVAELNAEWEQLKADATGEQGAVRGVFEGIPAGMPTLAKAAKLVRRMDTAGVWEEPPAPSSDDFGGQLLRTVAAAYRQGIDPDRALRLTLNELTRDLDDGTRTTSMEE